MLDKYVSLDSIRRRDAEARQRRKSEEERQQREQIDKLKERFSELRKREADLEAIVSNVTPYSEAVPLAQATAELAALRRIIESFPDKVRASWDPPETAAEAGRRAERARLADNIAAWKRAIDYITKHELPAHEGKMKQPPTLRELNAWSGFPDPRERHFKLLDEQQATMLARIEVLKCFISEAEGQLEKMK